MSTLTESFRMMDVTASVFVRQKMARLDEQFMMAQAGVVALPAIELDPVFPGMEIAAKVSRALTRPTHVRRTAEEERAEERLNTITHGLGLVLSAAAVTYLVTFAATEGGWLRVLSCGVYGATLMMMYASSTGLHAARRPGLKRRLQLCDHVSIYLLIAGSYTPFLVILMHGLVGYTLLACVWGLAAVGIAIKLKNADRLGETSPLPCLALGWLIVAAIKPLLAVLPMAGMALLVAGGVSYSIGMLFYCRDDKKYFHAIWHLWVIAGTGCHFAAVLFYVAV